MEEISERANGNDSRFNLPVLTISAETGWMTQEDKFSGDISGRQKKNYTLLYKGELSYNYGNSKVAKYGAVFGLQNYSEALIPHVYRSFRIIKETAPVFIENFFKKRGVNKQLRGYISSSARMDGSLNISYSDFMKIHLFISQKVSETKQAGKIFEILNSLLSLQQRKLELENQLKQFNLQNLFSGEQRLYPKVRFRGFDEPWKKVKLGRDIKRIRRKNKNLETNTPLTISAQSGLVDQRDFFGRAVASENLASYTLLRRGEFAYNKSYSKEAPYGSIKRLEKYNEGALSTLYIAFTPEDINSDFSKTSFDTTKWYSHIAQVSIEGARNHGLLNISPQDFFEMSITIPESDEQNNISRIYNPMNSPLSLQQQDINTTQRLKQFLLQNLFI